MTKKIAIVALLTLFVLGMTAFAADTNFGVGKTRTVSFSEPTKVGTSVLPKGEYKVLHLMEGNEHIMVFKSTYTNKEVAKVKCNMQKLDKKSTVTMNEISTVNNDRVLTGIVFAGDDYRHAF